MKQAYRRLTIVARIIPIMLVGYSIVGYGKTLSPWPTGKSMTTDTVETVSNPLGHRDSGIAGIWRGSTLADCGVNLSFPSRCNAEQKVTITLMQGQSSKITGQYSCSYGNMDCYHANETGRVAGVSINGTRMNVRVIMPDGTSCIFSGHNRDQTINGGYSCYQGAALIEQGSWRAQRSY